MVKYVSIFTERKADRGDLYGLMQKEVRAFAAEGAEPEYLRHSKIYDKMWNQADLRIKGDFDLNRAALLRL